MSWIKNHKFSLALGSSTLAAATALLFVAINAGSKHDQAKANFDAAVEEARSFEGQTLYPRQENRDGKQKTLDDYRKSLESLQEAFEKFRPGEIKNISPQEFTSRLKSTNEELRQAFGTSGTRLPESFFCGFESYKDTLARGNATGVLDYQLTGVRAVLMALAAAGPKELKNLHRPPLEEENGVQFKASDGQIARAMPLEITFRANEKSLRAFFTSLSKLEKHYAVVRSIRVTNTKKEPPRASDAKFDAPIAQAPANEGAAADDASGDQASSTKQRILSQVLGMEEVQVFVRLDLMQFLPAAKLP